jgi:hypothetical protein
MRLCFVLASLCWLIYGFIHHSIGGVITEIFVQTMTVTTIFRFHRDKKNKTHD